ncbi:hypothetical protein PoB_000174400 [Plakobranchus ocellatus]|uniref:Uncharacterized protein n=1 Tax=Plakobranchus ocellatus TaxID=259542 RepID=A0AAV3XWJ6_9GAST|nr:hypothetical protein PoB_000174400 [Plakobranchus ocellatus]
MDQNKKGLTHRTCNSTEMHNKSSKIVQDICDSESLELELEDTWNTWFPGLETELERELEANDSGPIQRHQKVQRS